MNWTSPRPPPSVIIRDHLSELVSQGWTDIALDIAELRYIDSTGLSLFIMTQKRVEEMGGSLVVHYPTKAALRLFDTTGLTARLTSTGCANDLIPDPRASDISSMI